MSMAAPLATHLGTPTRLDRLGGGRWWRAAKHALDGVAPLAVLSPASGRSMLNGLAVNDNALISRQGGIKYVVGADGVITLAPANTLAYDWSSGVRELLFEGSATNLLMASAGSPAPGGGCTVTSGVTGPDGQNNAGRLTTTGGVDPRVQRTVALAPSGLTVTFSIWARLNAAAGNTPKARIYLYGLAGAEQQVSALVDLTTKWTRYTLTKTFGAGMTSTTFVCRIDPFDVTGLPDETPLAGGSIDIDCWQVETGSVASSYIPTSGATVTRPADVAPLWSGAGAATSWAWRGNVPALIAGQLLLGGSNTGASDLIVRAKGATPAQLTLIAGNSFGLDSSVNAIPGIIGVCGGWGASGRMFGVLGTTVSDALPGVAVGGINIGGRSGVMSGQVLRLRELVAWQLPDRPSAAGCQAQARLWSA